MSMAASSVSRAPCTLRAAQRDRDSYTAHALLRVTVQVPLACVQVLSYSVYRDEASSVWARYVPQANPSRMAWPGPRVLFTASNETGCGVKERLHLDVRRSRSTYKRTALNEAFNLHQNLDRDKFPIMLLLADQARCGEPGR